MPSSETGRRGTTRDKTSSREQGHAAFFHSPFGLFLGRLLIFSGALLAWEFSSGPILPEFWISRPSAIFAELYKWFQSGSVWPHIVATFTAAVIGYAIGAAVAVLCGFSLGFFPRFQRIVEPYLSALYALPKIALAPLIVIVFGIGIESKVALVAVTVFFLVLYSTIDGVRDIDRDLVTAVRQMGASSNEIIVKVLIPATLPWVFTGMRIAVRYALTAAILGELIAANSGLGFLVQSNAGYFNATGVFAAVLLLVVCSVSVTEGLTHAETLLTRRRR